MLLQALFCNNVEGGKVQANYCVWGQHLPQLLCMGSASAKVINLCVDKNSHYPKVRDVEKPVTMSSSSAITFSVQRKEAELIPPTKPTPYEFKPLSDLDDQKSLRKHNKCIQIYHNNVEMKGKDPVKVIKQAIADALVYYYPLAGRLREGANDKLVVECTGEGVLFVEANADLHLNQFAGIVFPPVPGAEDLLYDVPGSAGVLHSPLLLFQVTRFMCGGFTFGYRINHTMMDATGMVQFVTAISEMARGARVLSIIPIWRRELLYARDPPRVSCEHHAYRDFPQTIPKGLGDWIYYSIFFGQAEMSSLRKHLQPPFHRSSTFDILTAFFWRCRTIALQFSPEDIMRLALAVNARTKFNPSIPIGYYGNCIGKPIALSTAGELCKRSLEYALDLVKRAKEDVTEEYVRSTADFLATNGRPPYSSVGIYHVSGLTTIKFNDIDFGWGKAVYGGPLLGGRPATFFISSKNNKNEDGIVATIGLPEPAMKKFVIEVEKMVTMNSPFIMSTM